MATRREDPTQERKRERKERAKANIKEKDRMNRTELAQQVQVNNTTEANVTWKMLDSNGSVFERIGN